ncbi:choice-of-anchor D domain-containing protein [Chryseobacterium sp. MP_3.2]|uniref:choice-of-anchor D domain-containing protein n=1 Tax=Chryseobacterium sp. MP_3.2 TaxID=3071712 RepID=UPI002E087DA1|nr:hypothetical protein [Chryseobacterium sp. MP_3.2]
MMKTNLFSLVPSRSQTLSAISCFKTFQKYLLAAFLMLSSVGVWGQVWNYNFGTGTGTFTSSTASTTFLPAPSAGTSRVRVGTNPGAFTLSNPGIAIGTNSEVQFTSNTGSTSTSKFSIYDYPGGKVGYMKFKIAFNGGTNGVYNLSLGDGLAFSDNNAIATGQVFSQVTWSFGTSNTVSYTYLNDATSTSVGLTNPTTLFSQSTSNEYAVEIYMNNTTATTNYVRAGPSYSLANAKWDLWVNGVRVGTALNKGVLGANANIDSFAFNHQASSTAPGTIYIDDIEYSNTLPSVATYALFYNGNTNTSGTAPTDSSSPYTVGSTVTVLGAGTLVKTGSTFSGWNTAADGSGTLYAAGATFAMPANALTLFAQWTLNNTAPTVATTSANPITTTSADSGGNVTADGGATVTARGVAFGTTAAPTTGTSETGTTGSFTSSLTSLSVNSQYFYRAYATNSVGTSYGTEISFYTLANIPSAPTVATPTSTSLNVSINANGNPATTEYAMYEIGGNFVQANGTLDTATVWQTAATWGTKTVTGLIPSTTYTFETKARNGATVETAYSGTTSGTSLANETLTFANLQFPSNTTIAEGGTTETVYAKAYKAGLTEVLPLVPPGLQVWIGISPKNAPASSDPNTWTKWIPASWFSQELNDDQYATTINSATENLNPGTYRYASRFQIGTGSYTYGGYNGGFWDGTTNISGTLTINSNVVGYANIQSPYSGTITQGTDFNVYAQTYKAGITDIATVDSSKINAWIGISTTNATTESDFASWTWIPATYNTKIANNFEYFSNIGGAARPVGIYYYVSRFQVVGSTEYKYGGTNNNFWTSSANSGVLTIQTAQEINIKQSTDIATGGTYGFGNQVSGTSGSAVTFTIENKGEANLILSGTPKIVISGTNAAEFTINQTATISPITGNSSTSFIVTFFPTTLGAKIAQLSIANNDSNENPYLINLTGTGTASAASDIVIKSGYVYPQNIPYANYQATDINGGANDIEIAKFTIRDGGASADADNLGTSLSQLTLSTSNFSNIRRIALYDGAIEIAEQAGAATHTFTGLNLLAPDNGTKDFSVRVSFNTAVTDNQQIVLGVTATTSAASTASTFAATNAGGAASSSSGDDIRIEVTADRLAFVQQPSNANVNVAMSPAVTLSANDVNGNRDLDFGSLVEITSNGTLNISPANATAISGLGSFNAIVHTAQGTGRSLTASFTGLTSATSNTFNITLVSAATDRFKTRTSGNWSSASTWESSSDGNTWVNPSTLAPTSSAFSIEILNAHTVTTTASATAKNLTVKTGGTLTLDNQITNDGRFKVENGGTVVVNYSVADLSTNIWKGDEDFEPESIFKFKLINSSANLFTFSLGVPVVTPRTYDGYTALFGQLVFEAANGWSSFLPTDANFNLTHKDLYINYTAISNFSLFSGNSVTMGIGRDLIVNTNTSSFNVTYQTGAGNSVLNVRRNFIKNGTGNGEFRFSSYTTSSANNITFNIDGDFIINNGIVNMIQGNSGGSIFTLNLKGNLNILAGRLYNSNTISFASCAFNFVGLSEQTVNYVPSSSFAYIPIHIKNGANLKLINQDFALGTNSKIIVENGGILNFGYNGSVALNLTANGTLQTFNAQSGSILKITSPHGVTTAAAGANSGNVQTPVSGRTFDKGATYHYIGKTNQVTGNGIPDQITGKLIVELDTQNIAQDDLQFTSSGTTTFGTVSGVNGVLEIKKGKVLDQPNFGFRNYNGALDDGETDIQRGDFIMLGGRYVVSGAGTKPSLSGMYTISAGTVEFAGSAATKIRTSTPAKQYYNVEVSGTNVEAGGKNLIVNQITTIANTGQLTIPSTLEGLSPNVITSRRAVLVNGNGIFNLENNAQLMQDADATNVGNINVKRIATVPNSTFNQYVYWSSPVDNQNLRGIFPGQTTAALYYNESNDKFYTSSGAYIEGRGLAVRNPSTSPGPLTAKFTGKPYVGNLSFPLAFTDTAHGYNLVGNPYPSNLDLNKLYANSTSIEAKFQFWDNTSNTEQSQLGTGYMGYSYAIYNPAAGNMGSGNPAPGNGGTEPSGIKAPNRILKIGQGFIARATASGASLNFTNADRITDQTDAQFFGKSAVDSINNRYWLEMVTPANLRFSNAIVYFDNGTNEFSLDDTKMESSVSDALFTNAGEEKVVINGRSIFTDTDVLKVGNRFFTSGTYKIRLGTKEGIFDNGQNIYLKDFQTGIITNLSQGSYSFPANAGEQTGRFEIIYKPESILTVNDPLKDQLQVYRNGDQFVISSTKGNIDEVELYDVSGRMVLKVKSTSNKVLIDVSLISSGGYVLKIKRNYETISKKIIIL